MADNIYNFYKTETEDGIDYFFCTTHGRTYTVSFDMSLYDCQVDKFPTLLEYGYGFLFKFEQSIPKDLNKKYDDPFVRTTISAIISDFLSTNKDYFIVYECPGYKQEKLFCDWSDPVKYPAIFEYGIQLEITGVSMDYFGFISAKNNPHLTDVISEIETFFFSL